MSPLRVFVLSYLVSFGLSEFTTLLGNLPDEVLEQIQVTEDRYRTFLDYYDTADVKAYDLSWASKFFKDPVCHNGWVLHLLSNSAFRDEYYLCVRTEGNKKRLIETTQLRFSDQQQWIFSDADNQVGVIVLELDIPNKYIFYKDGDDLYMTTPMCMSNHYYLTDDKIFPPEPPIENKKNFIKYFYTYQCRPVRVHNTLKQLPIEVKWRVAGGQGYSPEYIVFLEDAFKSNLLRQLDQDAFVPTDNLYYSPDYNVTIMDTPSVYAVKYLNHFPDYEIIYFEHITSNFFLDLIEFVLDRVISLIVTILSTIFNFVLEKINQYVFSNIPYYFKSFYEFFFSLDPYVKFLIMSFVLIYIKTTKFIKTIFLVFLLTLFTYNKLT